MSSFALQNLYIIPLLPKAFDLSKSFLLYKWGGTDVLTPKEYCKVVKLPVLGVRQKRKWLSPGFRGSVKMGL